MISIDSSKTILLPASVYEKGLEKDFLRFNGMEPSEGEIVVVSRPVDGIVAVMAVAASVLDEDTLAAVRESRASSPLLQIATGRKRDVNIRLTAQNVYIVVWEKGLRMAEVLPDSSVDSLLYYMQVLGRRFKLKKFDINVSGEGTSEAVEVLQKYFSNVRVCE